MKCKVQNLNCKNSQLLLWDTIREIYIFHFAILTFK